MRVALILLAAVIYAVVIGSSGRSVRIRRYRCGLCPYSRCIRKGSKCQHPADQRRCNCPRGWVCCRFYCTTPGCHGECRRGPCPPYSLIPAYNKLCNCPDGYHCYRKLTNCERYCKYSQCVTTRYRCRRISTRRKCSCPKYMHCCQFWCRKCGGQCYKIGGPCPPNMVSVTSRNCDCPPGYRCLKRATCGRSKHCKYAKCVSTRYRCHSRARSSCTCPNGLHCCRFSCLNPYCKGVCKVKPCPKSRLPVHNKYCHCPPGEHCWSKPNTCVKNCKYGACVPLNHICKFGTHKVKCQCPGRQKCCRFYCESRTYCGGKCMKGRRCPNKWIPVYRKGRTCRCPPGWTCCKRITCPGCGHDTRCIPKGQYCKYVRRPGRCTCPANKKCCSYTCTYRRSGCKGTCHPIKCPFNKARARPGCTCPRNYVCCTPTRCERKCGSTAKCVPLSHPCKPVGNKYVCSCRAGHKCCTFNCRTHCGGYCRKHCGTKLARAPSGCKCGPHRVCCVRPTCRTRCGGYAWCVHFRHPCKGHPRCSCPKYKKCCTFYCQSPGCRGRCLKYCPKSTREVKHPGCKCRPPFKCCKVYGCESRCGPLAKCVKKSHPCIHPVNAKPCNCYFNQRCCLFKCETRCCGGRCIRKKYCPGYRVRAKRTCNCRPNYVCCIKPTCRRCMPGYSQCLHKKHHCHNLATPPSKCTCPRHSRCCLFLCHHKRYCGGYCTRGRCPSSKLTLTGKCRCPPGYSCCKEPECRRYCGRQAACVRKKKCLYPRTSKLCTCPTGQICCCFICGTSACGGFCRKKTLPCPPNYIVADYRCNCQPGYKCCKAVKCRLRCGKYAQCVPEPSKYKCMHPIPRRRKCTCPYKKQCCLFLCESRGCCGKCIKRRFCPNHLVRARNRRCNCPPDYVCCKRPCCKKCGSYAECVPTQKCFHPLPSRCTCPRGKVCCWFLCSKCGGYCRRHRCPSNMVDVTGRNCNCIRGFRCCKKPTCGFSRRCPYSWCVPRGYPCRFKYRKRHCTCPGTKKCCQFFCQHRRCGGRCKLRCPPRTTPVNFGYCNCPPPYKCCKYIRCRRCNKYARCTHYKLRCLHPVGNQYTCTCPNHYRCCAYYCRSCGGSCHSGRCPGHLVRVRNHKCNCPNGKVCCKVPTCTKCSRNAMCVYRMFRCKYPHPRPAACTCPRNRRCCLFFCRTCHGVCRKRCPSDMVPMRHPKCNCPPGKTCCKRFYCKRRCGGYARCVTTKYRCRHPARDRRCTCPHGMQCCRFFCQSRKCKGICRTRCPKGLIVDRINKWCNCPPGQSCCKPTTCHRCYKYSRCVLRRFGCRYPAPRHCTCPLNFVCCLYRCNHGACKGHCRRGCRCGPRYAQVRHRICTCPRGRVCCKAPYCARCNPFAKCVPRHHSCKWPITTPACDCPAGKKCCRYYCNSRHCNGSCHRGRGCRRGYTRSYGKYCNCPKGYTCCKRTPCYMCHKFAKCVRARKCLCPLNSKYCVCPRHYRCCYFYCQHKGYCGGRCVKGCRCPGCLARAVGKYCNCPPGYVCCKRPQCAKKCGKWAQCVRDTFNCRHPIPHKHCTCPHRKRCCRFVCKSVCKGECRRRCRCGTYPMKHRYCQCPPGFHCCKARDCSKKCGPYAQCVHWRHNCGHPRTSPLCHCPPRMRCCRFLCPTCKGFCRSKCPKGYYAIRKRRCNCPPGQLCCKLQMCDRKCRGRCVPNSFTCRVNLPSKLCTCPRGKKCCKFLCEHTRTCGRGARCYRRRHCPPNLVEHRRHPCQCPPHRVCCRAPDCRPKCGVYARCVKASWPCIYNKSKYCTCPPGKKCCRFYCERGDCKGRCIKGRRCRWGYMLHRKRTCKCPPGYTCCIRPTCRKRCGPYAQCVGDRVKCHYPLNQNLCTCPRGQRCCKFLCPKCKGVCYPRDCPSNLVDVTSKYCDCPANQRCGKPRTCHHRGPCGRYAKCVPNSYPCHHREKKCTCPKGTKCCKFFCEHPSKCKGVCYRKCPGKKYEVKSRYCSCPKGLRCCKAPFCQRHCGPYAKCVRKGYPCVHPKRLAKCTCPPWQQCCIFKCRLRCKGYCRRRCPRGYYPLGIRRCDCPPGLKCCKAYSCYPRKCGGRSMCVPSWFACANHLDRIRCVCQPGKKCCRFDCQVGPCRGSCRPKKCGPGYYRVRNRKCDCPPPYVCCKPYLCKRCRRYNKCVHYKFHCLRPMNPKCSCPPRQRCCQFLCQTPSCPRTRCHYKCCRGGLIPTRKGGCQCRPPFVCCTAPTCRTCSKYARCVLHRKGYPCDKQHHPNRCTCPRGYRCCQLLCKHPSCGGTCHNGQCPRHLVRVRGKGCSCRRGRVCCKAPTCCKNCRPFAHCVRKNFWCAYPQNSPKCTCPRHYKCCKFKCRLGVCGGRCYPRGCPRGWTKHRKGCQCPPRQHCCRRITCGTKRCGHYATCVPKNDHCTFPGLKGCTCPEGQKCCFIYCKVPRFCDGCCVPTRNCPPHMVRPVQIFYHHLFGKRYKRFCNCRHNRACCIRPTCRLKCNAQCVPRQKCLFPARFYNAKGLQKACLCTGGRICCIFKCRKCGGRCWPRKCPSHLTQSRNKYCNCPRGKVCCVAPTCNTNNYCGKGYARCVHYKHRCAHEANHKTCTCPAGKKCCKFYCNSKLCKGHCRRGFHCGRRLVKVFSKYCDCPPGQSCCEPPTCRRCHRNADCVRGRCLFPARKGCTCPCGTRCCRFFCGTSKCPRAQCKRSCKGLVHAGGKFCNCRPGFHCCRRPTCGYKCGHKYARCVYYRHPCRDPVLSKSCTCPRYFRCCNFKCHAPGCHGRCLKRRFCPRCMMAIDKIPGAKCFCPKGYRCCKVITCGRRHRHRCKYGKCVPSGEKCGHPLPTRLCTCPPMKKCCHFNCKRCGGSCKYGSCGRFLAQIPIAKCTCPRRYVCCEVPKCRPLCGRYASCVSKSYNCPNKVGKRCTCPSWQRCCRFYCGTRGCYGLCKPGRTCPKHLVAHRNKRCNCRPGFVCCKCPTCRKCSKWARCVKNSYPCPNPMSTRCTCPAGLKCCNFFCRRCRGGRCYRKFCPGLRVPMLNKRCNCQPPSICCQCETCRGCGMYAGCVRDKWCLYPVNPKADCRCARGRRCCYFYCRRCRGHCRPGSRCPSHLVTLRKACNCPRGYSCCQKRKCTAKRCGRGSMCIPNKDPCKNPRPRSCTCPADMKCCRFFCGHHGHCQGRCYTTCPLNMVPVKKAFCTCPRGKRCCTVGKCERDCGTIAQCVLKRDPCKRIKRSRCSCPPGKKCCNFYCTACGGTCLRKCPFNKMQAVNPKCSCPMHLKCCIPPTCRKLCGRYAKCVARRVCRRRRGRHYCHRIKCQKPVGSKWCGCPAHQQCCYFFCETKGCRGRCFPGKCPGHLMRAVKKGCVCPPGSSCCKKPTCPKCPYSQCVSRRFRCRFPQPNQFCGCPSHQQCCCFYCQRHCKGRCYKRCPACLMRLTGKYCNCPNGQHCCKRPTCRRCKDADCLDRRFPCYNPANSRHCRCPRRQRCCKFLCRKCGGCCRRRCPYFMADVTSKGCNCRPGFRCCRKPTCARYCRLAMCVPMREYCRLKITSRYCKCPVRQRCCRFLCSSSSCGGKCVRSCRCKAPFRRVKSPKCTCPRGYTCCQGPCPFKPCVPQRWCTPAVFGKPYPSFECKKKPCYVCCAGTCPCPYPCRTVQQCGKLHGTRIASTNCKNGLICCKTPRLVWVHLPNTQVYGGIYYAPAKSVAACKLACENKVPNCKAIDWYKPAKQCYTYNKAGGKKVKNNKVDRYELGRTAR